MKRFIWLTVLLIVTLLFAAPVAAQDVTAEAPPGEVVTMPVEVEPGGVPDALYLIVIVVLAIIPTVDKALTSGAGKEAIVQLGASAPKWVTDGFFYLAQERIVAGKERAALTDDKMDDVSIEELERQMIELQRLIDAKRAGTSPPSLTQYK